jgi:membrane-bound lytic murein transglycosylase B
MSENRSVPDMPERAVVDHREASGMPVGSPRPLQFIPATWQQWGHGDIQDINQAAARYLCADNHDLHTTTGRHAAALSYNHANWYATDILAIYTDYLTATPAHTFPIPPGTTS